MYRLYKTYINSDGSYFDMEAIHFNCIQEYHKLLNRSLKTCEAYEGVLCNVAYTTKPLYLSEAYQRSAVYHISNANDINTLTEFKKCLKEYFPEYINYISNENIRVYDKTEKIGVINKKYSKVEILQKIYV